LLVKVSHCPTGIVGVGVAVGPPGVCEAVGVGELTGPAEVGVGVVDGVKVGTGVSAGVVGAGPGVGVDVLPRIVRLPGIKSIAVREFSPVETRA
jgi:hypothetical protein